MTSIQEATATIVTEAERAELEALSDAIPAAPAGSDCAFGGRPDGDAGYRPRGRLYDGDGLEVAGALRRKAACRPRRDWRAGQRSQIHLRDGQAHPLRSRQPRARRLRALDRAFDCERPWRRGRAICLALPSRSNDRSFVPPKLVAKQRPRFCGESRRDRWAL